jgi:hypothetical protein
MTLKANDLGYPSDKKRPSDLKFLIRYLTGKIDMWVEAENKKNPRDMQQKKIDWNARHDYKEVSRWYYSAIGDLILSPDGRQRRITELKWLSVVAILRQMHTNSRKRKNNSPQDSEPTKLKCTEDLTKN